MLGRYGRLAAISFKGMNPLFNPAFLFLVIILGPFFQILLYVTMARYYTGTENLDFWIIGNTTLMSIEIFILSLIGYFTRERQNGTLKFLFASPYPTIYILGAFLFFPVLASLVQVSLSLGACKLLFGISLPVRSLPLYGLNLLVTMFATACFGLFTASLGLIIPQVNLILNFALFGLVIFSGANYPIDVLPAGMRWISALLPLNRGIRSARIIAGGGFQPSLMLGELIVGIVYLVICLFLLEEVKKTAKKMGTIELY